MTLFMLSCQREDVKLPKLLSLSTVENRTAEPCKPINGGVPCIEPTVFLAINLPMFGSCVLQIQMQKYDCGLNGIFYGPPFIHSHNCPAFDAWLNNCMSDPATFRDCMELLTEQIILEIGLLNHPPGSTTITPYLINSACNQWCVGSEWDPRGYYVKSLSQLRCSDACCLKEFQYKKINGNWTYFGCTSTRYGGIGCDYQHQAETCAHELYTTSCIDDCECEI